MPKPEEQKPQEKPSASDQKLDATDGASPTAKVLEAKEVQPIPKAPPADASLAGKYSVTHGAWKIGDKHYDKGSLLQLDAEDAKRGLDAGTIAKYEE